MLSWSDRGPSRFRTVVSIYHLLMKFLTRHGIKEVHGDQALAWHYKTALQEAKSPTTLPIEGLDTRDELIEE